MQKSITNKDFPVEKTWLLKIPVSLFILIIISSVFFGLFLQLSDFMEKDREQIFLIFIGIQILILLVIGIILTPIYSLLINNFHYSLESDSVIFHNGFFSKKTKKISYVTLKNIYVYQDMADRIFGLASVIVTTYFIEGLQNYWEHLGRVGFIDNINGSFVIIPGLSLENAEKLKSIFLTKNKKITINNDRLSL